MPEYINSLKDINLEIQQFLSSRDGYVKQDVDMTKDIIINSMAKKFDKLPSPLQDRSHVHREITSKKARAKESSKHFGVRFRPDLNKWVAEIRVAEWKLVDKKVWLGTFETEEGAARAVDAARKLLKCKKERLPNFPCSELDTFSEQLPPRLNLNNLENDAMYKDATIFIKRKAQEYAASFFTPNNSNFVLKQVQAMVHETSFYSELELPQANSQEEMSLDSQDPFSSYESWADEGALPLCKDEVAHDHWQFGDFISQLCTSGSDTVNGDQEHEAVSVSHSLWEDAKHFSQDMEEYAMLDHLVTSLEYDLIPSDNQDYYAQDQTMSMDIISEHEISCDSFLHLGELSFQKPSFGTVDSNMDWNHWMLSQQLHNSPFASSDCTQVY